jgi:hypothetical protein
VTDHPLLAGSPPTPSLRNRDVLSLPLLILKVGGQLTAPGVQRVPVAMVPCKDEELVARRTDSVVVAEYLAMGCRVDHILAIFYHR